MGMGLKMGSKVERRIGMAMHSVGAMTKVYESKGTSRVAKVTAGVVEVYAWQNVVTSSARADLLKRTAVIKQEFLRCHLT